MARRRFFLYLVLIFFVFSVDFILFTWPTNHPKAYGITWSSPYAWSLGLNPNEALRNVLDDLGVRRFRIPAYWTDIERKQGIYDFSILQEQLDEIAKRDGKVLLAIGARLPRWPECWVPDFVKGVGVKQREEMQMAYLQATYNQFKYHPTIIGFQIENEAHFTNYVFCPGLTNELVSKEIQYIQAEEAELGILRRPVYTTDSGELSFWRDHRREIDLLGVSVYRTVTSPTFGVFHYWFLPPWFYSTKAYFLGWGGRLFVSELQMEPWSEIPLQETTFDDQFKTMSLQQMQNNFLYASHMDVPAVDFWGAEWWYWMNVQGRPEFWNKARDFFKLYQ